MSGMKVLKWAWRCYSLEVAQFATLDDAVDSARLADDMGDEALVGVEVWGDDGYRYLPASVVLDMGEARRPAEPEPTQWSAVVQVTSPSQVDDGPRRKVSLNWFTTIEAAEACVAEWRPLLGDRLSIRKITE